MTPTPPHSPTARAMLEEVADLATGLGVGLLPLFVLAVPAMVLFVLLPALLLLALAAPVAVLGAVIAAPAYLVSRGIRAYHGPR